MSRTVVCIDCGRERPNKGHGRCAACYRTWYRSDPANAAKDRAISLAWKNAHREENRSRDREYLRTPEMRGECDTCGGPMGIGSARNHTTCRACYESAAHLKRQMMVELWRGGATCSQVAEAFGWTIGRFSMEMDRARRLGYDLPYRRTPEQRARMVAGRLRAVA